MAGHIARKGIALLAGSTLAACSLAPAYHVPNPPAAAAYKEAAAAPQPDVGSWTTAAPADGQARGSWWTVFEDAQLDQLEQRAFSANQNLAAAAARYREARAVADAAGSQLFPNVDINASGERERISKNAPSNTSGAPHTTGDYILRAQTSYELDFWGRVRNTVAAAHSRAQASAADLATALLSIQGELAGDYVELRGLDSQIELLVSTVDAYGRALQITQDRYNGGAAAIVDVDQANTQLETAQVQLGEARLSRAQMEHAIAILIGVPPAELALTPVSLGMTPPLVTPGLPSRLLERRPDVASAERQMFAANAEVGIARAAWFPTFSLDAGFGFESTHTGNWLEAPSQTWSAGPSMVLNALDWGRRRAQNAQARAAYDEAVANYRQTVIEAFGQVEDQLAAIHWLDAQLDAQRRADVSSQHLLDQAYYRYKGGIATYLEVVTAQNTFLQARQTEVDLRVRRLVASLQLIKALGGDWSNAQLQKPLLPPKPDVVSSATPPGRTDIAMSDLRTCMRDKIRDLIVERILDGTYPPAMHLKEMVLATEFHVSQAPVREALRELEALGLVQSERYRGTHVRAADIQQLREAYELRALIEERAAQLAVPCSASVLESLHRELDRMGRTLRAHSYKEHAAAAAAFHRILVTASGNMTFVRAWEALHWEVRTRVAMQQLRDRGIKLDDFLDAHIAILRFLEAGDGIAAGGLLRELMEGVRVAIEQKMPIEPLTAATKNRERRGA